MRNTLSLAVLLGAGIANAQDWSSITPSKDLEWHDCLKTFKCARLEMPLDWKNESDPRTVAIAMMKAPAAVDVSDPAYGGPIFFNPGGPGHSGVEFVPTYAARMQSIIDKPGKRHYDVVSFDPRGIASSTPTVDCLQSQIERDAFFMELRGTQGLGMGRTSVAYSLAMMDGLGKKCHSQYDKGLDIFPHISSASVVRDMVQMADKTQELQKKDLAKRGLEHRAEEGEARIQFLGFSYGTVLANYLMSMYPGRVKRVVADGVVDAVDYATGPGWLKSGTDTDLVWDRFFQTCFEAKDECALWRKEYSSPDEIKKPVEDMISKLDSHPIGGLAADGHRVTILGDDFVQAWGVFMYNGITGFQNMAALLDAALQGDYSLLVILMKSIRAIPTMEDGCPGANATAPPLPPPEYLYSVMCTDGDDVSDKDLAWWQDYIADQEDVSTLYGSTLALVRFGCSGWPFRAKWRFTGPFTSPKADPDISEGKPAAPMLFLTNKYDPVTPMRNARNMAKGHPGAGVVQQESIGHCALLSASSNCTSKVLQEYFDSGKVPGNETVCQEECHAWDPDCKIGGGSSAKSASPMKRGLMGEARMPIMPRLPFHPRL